jgi:hypothetical protein
MMIEGNSQIYIIEDIWALVMVINSTNQQISLSDEKHSMRTIADFTEDRSWYSTLQSVLR